MAPRNELESVCAELWEEAFAIEGIGVHDDFFELGGHSLMAVQVASEVRRVLEVDLEVAAILETPTVAGLAELIASELSAGASPEEMAAALAEIESLPEDEVLPLLVPQELEAQEERR